MFMCIFVAIDISANYMKNWELNKKLTGRSKMIIQEKIIWFD